MHMSKEDDVSGIEVFIVGSKSGYHALIQCSPGEPYEPFLVNVNVSGNKIEMNFPDQWRDICGTKSVIGVVKKDVLELMPKGISEHWILKRGNSFWIE